MSTTNPRMKESKFSKCVKAPFRVLSRARDLYVRSLSNCAGNVTTYGGSLMGGPAPHLTTLPPSFSVGSSQFSSDNDLRDLIRAASTRIQQKRSPVAGINHAVPRSRTVAVGRIDEDNPCEFQEDIKLKTDLYPRSRSYAITKRRVY